MSLHALTLAAVAALALAGGGPRQDAREVRGGPERRVDWFEGTFDELLAAGRESERPILVHFWAHWSERSARVERTVLRDAEVLGRLDDYLCFSIDTDVHELVPSTGRYGVTAVPCFVFLEPDGSPRDKLPTYLPTYRFLQELERIGRGQGTLPALRAAIERDGDDLIAPLELAIALRAFGQHEEPGLLVDSVRERLERGGGGEPRDLDARWVLAQKLRDARAPDLYEEQMAAIERSDPERKTRAGRAVAIERAIAHLRESLDEGPLRALLEEERDPELCYQGWAWVRGLRRHYLAQKAAERREFHAGEGEEEQAAAAEAERVEHERAAREASRKAWASAPDEFRGEFGDDLVRNHYAARAQLSDEERKFALSVAERIVAIAPREARYRDAYACALFAAGRIERAIEQARASLELDPGDEQVRARLAEFEAAR